MVVGADLLGFLSQKRLGERVSANISLRETYEETCRIAAAHSVDPVVLREDGISTERVFELMRESETGYVYLEYPSTVRVDPLDDNWGIGDSFGVQLINPEGAQSSWLDSESADCVTVANVRETGRELDAAFSSLFEQVQIAWGVEVDFPCFVEALRHELHKLSASRLHTAYFHSIDLSRRPDGPTLVKVQTSRVEQKGEEDVAIVEEPLRVRRARPGAPAFAISSADDGLAGRYRVLFPGISLPFGILSWPLTSALLHWLSYIKQLLPRIPGDVMAALGIVRIVQKPLQAVITLPGLVFHFTISTGTSEAEATNFHVDLPDRQFVDIWRSWCQYARRCAQDLSRLPKPWARRTKNLQQCAEARHEIAWRIGRAMGLTCQEFVDAPVPKKWGREQEIVQEKSAVCHKAADHQNPERGHATSDGSPEESSEESSEESAEKSGKKRAAANATPDKRGNSVKRTPGGGKKRSTEEISGTSRGADAAGKSTKRAKKSSATPLAGDTSKNLIDPAEFDSIIAVVRNQLFNDSVPKEEYIKLQQENSKLVSECKRVEDLAASRQAALEEYASLLSRMNAVTKPK
ncbi:g1085 [Coccomyxa elongata]